MTRRDAIKAISAALTAALALRHVPLTVPEIDWKRWNRIDLHVADGGIRFYVNGADVTDWPSIIRTLAKFCHVDNEGIRFGTPKAAVAFHADDQPFNWARFWIRVHRMPDTVDLDDMVAG